MKFLKFPLFITLAFIVVASGCKKKFEDYSKNENLPQEVPPGLILKAVLNDINSQNDDQNKADQFIVSNYTYYGLNQYSTGSASLNYGSLRNVLAMEKEARRLTGSDNNPYHALGLFFRSFFFINMTEKVGDLPLTDALQGLENPSPKYDSQETIFKQSLLWLDSANTLLSGFLANGFLEFSGDFYYQERLINPLTARDALAEWQKVVNSYKLRVLIELSKHADDAALNIKQQFQTIVSNPQQYPVFTSNDDNLQYLYNSQYNYYPDNPSNYGFNAGRLNLGATFETNLAQLNDLRVMILAEPARGLGFSDVSFQSFAGGKSGDDISTLSTLSGAGLISLYNYNHYYKTFTAEPTLILSYAEVSYAIAEAINRGWIAGDAESYYVKGTEAMFDFYGIVDGSNQVVFRNSTGTGDVTYTVPFSFSAYFSQPSVKYKGDNAGGLAQILTEKYFAYFRNSGLQAYYQWRRTGIPAFSIGSGTGNGGKIPLRLQYPTNETTVNGDNLKTALQSQYGGNDDINAKMWLIQ